MAEGFSQGLSFLRDRRRIRIGIQVTALSLIFFFLGRNLYYYWDELSSYSWKPRPFYLAVSFILSLACAFLVALGWNLIMRSLGQNISNRSALRIYFLSGLGRYIPGKIWSFLGRMYLAEREGVPKILTSASIGVQLLVQVISAMIVVLIALPFCSSLKIERAYYFLFLLIPAGLIILHPFLFKRGLNLVLKKFRKVELDRELRYSQTLLLVLYWVALWLLKGGGVFFLLLSVYRQSLPPFSPLIMLGIVALAWTVATLSFIFPAGLGILEGSMYLLLQSLLLLSPGVAIMFALLSRVWSTVIELICVGLTFRLK